MRRLGAFLLVTGAALGGAVGIAVLGGIHLAGVPWLAAVGIAKLTLLASGGLMAGGAVCLRLDRRSAERKALAGRSPDRASD